MFFKSNKHLDKFKDLVIKFRFYSEDTGNLFNDIAAAMYIMSADDELSRKCLPYISTFSDGAFDFIDFGNMIAYNDFSSSYRQLAVLAAHFYNGCFDSPNADFVCNLDDDNFYLYIQSLKIRRNGCNIADLNLYEKQDSQLKNMVKKMIYLGMKSTQQSGNTYVNKQLYDLYLDLKCDRITPDLAVDLFENIYK